MTRIGAMKGRMDFAIVLLTLSAPFSFGFLPGNALRPSRIVRAAEAATAESDSECEATSKPQLFDLPVSNNGARVRMILYYKGLEEDVDVVSPMDLGGLRSPEYLAVNPQGKMPAMNTGAGAGGEDAITFGESDTIARYLLDRFGDKGPSLWGATPAERLQSNAIARHHDLYLGPIQGCMYKAFPPFATFGSRREALNELLRQLAILEDMVSPRASDEGPYLAGGKEPTLADCTVFPTAVFIDFMLPKFGISPDEFFGPTLGAWFYGTMGGGIGSEREEEGGDEGKSAGDAVAQRVSKEITDALRKWDERGRWDTIAGAGKRDEAPATIFDKILAGEIPSDVVHEDDKCLAFRDISPVAPTHVLVIPKHREGLTQLRHADAEHQDILGHLLVVAAKIAQDEGFTADGAGGYRIVINDGEAAAQSVFHLHVHIIGGRDMTWPPG